MWTADGNLCPEAPHGAYGQRLTKFGHIAILTDMSTINISMPDPMRQYVESQAERGNYSASEYVRQLIREDQKRQQQEAQTLLHTLLSISASQLDNGDLAEVTVEELLATGRKSRARKKDR